MFGETQKIIGKGQFHCELPVEELNLINISGIKKTYIVRMGMEFINNRGEQHHKMIDLEEKNLKLANLVDKFSKRNYELQLELKKAKGE